MLGDKEQYPTAAFPSARNGARHAHLAYKEHLQKAVPVPDVELQIKEKLHRELLQEEDEPAPAAAPEPEAPPPVEEAPSRPIAHRERDLVRTERERIAMARKKIMALNVAAAAWLALGVGQLLGTYLARRLPLPLLPAVYAVPVVVLAAWLLANFSWWTAKCYQLSKEGKVNPEDIPQLAQIGNVIRKEEFQTDYPTAQQESLLRRKLLEYNGIRRGGKTVAQAETELKLYAGGIIGVMLIFAACSLFVYAPHNILELVVYALVALAPVVLLFLTILPLSEVALDVPRILDFETPDPKAIAREQQAEGRKKQQVVDTEKARKDAKKAKIDSTQRDIMRGKAMEQYRREVGEHGVIEVRLLDQLRHAVEIYEQERGFTVQELYFMEAERRYLSRLRWLTYIFSAICAVVATYPASITVSEIFGFSYTFFSFTGATRFGLFPWALWIMAIGAAEVGLIISLVILGNISYAENILESTYSDVNRRKGYRYTIMTATEARRHGRWPKIGLCFCLFLLFLEFVSNVVYMIQFSDVNAVLGVLLSVVPFTLLIVGTWSLYHMHQSMHRLDDSLGRDDWRSRVPVAPRRPPGNGGERQAPSAQARQQVEDLGIRSIRKKP